MVRQMFNTRQPNCGNPRTLTVMAIQRDDDTPEIALRNLMERFRTAEERALIKRGIALWTHAERLLGIVPSADTTLPRNKIN
jgi:hypothetical protein